MFVLVTSRWQRYHDCPNILTPNNPNGLINSDNPNTVAVLGLSPSVVKPAINDTANDEGITVFEARKRMGTT